MRAIRYNVWREPSTKQNYMKGFTVESFQVNLTFAREDFQNTRLKNSIHHQNLNVKLKNDCFNSIDKQEPVPNLT